MSVDCLTSSSRQEGNALGMRTRRYSRPYHTHSTSPALRPVGRCRENHRGGIERRQQTARRTSSERVKVNLRSVDHGRPSSHLLTDFSHPSLLAHMSSRMATTPLRRIQYAQKLCHSTPNRNPMPRANWTTQSVATPSKQVQVSYIPWADAETRMLENTSSVNELTNGTVLCAPWRCDRRTLTAQHDASQYASMNASILQLRSRRCHLSNPRQRWIRVEEDSRMPMKPERCFWCYVSTRRRRQLRCRAERSARPSHKFRPDAAFPPTRFSTGVSSTCTETVVGRLKKQPVRHATDSRCHSLHRVDRSDLRSNFHIRSKYRTKLCA